MLQNDKGETEATKVVAWFDTVIASIDSNIETLQVAVNTSDVKKKIAYLEAKITGFEI